MNNLVILIPPSEGKSSGGSGRPLGRASENASPVIERLRSFTGDWQKLLGVKGGALDEAVEANKQILQSSTLPAIERYTGVVYDGLDYSSLAQKAKLYVDRHVRIVSAVFGLVSPQDLLPNYKLKIDKLGCAAHWKPIHAEALKGCFVVDCLPQAHAKAVSYKDGLKIDFCIRKGGVNKPAGHAGKLIKGKFIRWMAEHGIRDAAHIPSFRLDGFCWEDGVFVCQM